jgi:spermidine synthase
MSNNKTHKQLKPAASKSNSPLTLYVLILVSGAAGLIYEVVWARQLTLFIGNTAVANAAVLTAFMLGLALGSFVLGRKADRISNPLGLYALLEILIGCYGATTPWLFDLLQAAYANIAGVVGVSGPYSHIPRFLIAIVAMLIPTFLMGGTLPLLVKHFTSKLDEAQSVTSKIYGINTLGATLGAFCAGFLLLPNLGITSTLLLAAVVNVLVGLGVYQLLKNSGLQVFSLHQTGSATAVSENADDGIFNSSLLLFGFALSGFAALLYQVVWIHSLVLIIGVSTYAFSTVLTVFLGGVGLGSLWVGRFLRYKSAGHSLRIAFYLQLGIALSAIISLSLISQLPILWVQGWALFSESFVLFQAYAFLLTGLVIVIPTLLLGALFPLITGLWSHKAGGVGRGVGEAYGANALGTIVGSGVGGLFILDWMGIAGSLYLASAVSMLVAAMFWYMSRPEKSFLNRWVQIPMAALMLVVVAFVLPGWDRDILQAQVFRRADNYNSEDIRASIEDHMSKAEFLYYKEGIHGTVSVVTRMTDYGLQKKTLVNNGKADASNAGDMDTQILLAQIPMFLHPSPEQVMVIGLGSGVTAGSVLRKGTVRNLDILEISPEIVEASEFFREENFDVLNNPKANLIIADARNYMLASHKKYDVIISEPSHSWVTGVSNLFTREFLQQSSKRLKKNGILAQWYHLYGVDRHSLKALLKSVSDVFPHYTLWQPTAGDIVIISSNQPLKLDYQQQLLAFEEPDIKSDLARIGIHSMESLMDHFTMSSKEARTLLLGQQANTDENPVVEFNGPKHLYTATVDDNVHMLFEALDGGEYRLPFDNLIRRYQDWIVVPFMAIQLRHQGDGFLGPDWNVVRKSVVDLENDSYRLMGGMNGEMILSKPWGDVVVHATMSKRGAEDAKILTGMLGYEVSETKQSFNGELKAPGIVVFWRVGASLEEGKLRVVVAQKCERSSKFDSWVSLSSSFPGDWQNKADVGPAVKQLNSLFRCIPEAPVSY